VSFSANSPNLPSRDVDFLEGFRFPPFRADGRTGWILFPYLRWEYGHMGRSRPLCKRSFLSLRPPCERWLEILWGPREPAFAAPLTPPLRRNLSVSPGDAPF